MINYILRHLNLLVITLLMLSALSFALAYLFPGDPLANLSGQINLTQSDRIAVEQSYALEHGLLVQFGHYLQHLWNGNWGISFRTGQPLIAEVFEALPASIELSSYALLISILIGLPLGFLAGFKHHKTIDYGLFSVSMTGYSLPIFWLALLFIMVFSLQLGWFPISGRISLLHQVPAQTGFLLIDIYLSDIPDKSTAIHSALSHLVLPTLSITIVTATIILRITRRSVIEVLQNDYIQAAYTRGLSHWQVIIRHVVRNALLPILPLFAAQFTVLLTNAMIVEIIFSWPGIGSWLIQAIYQQDYPAIRVGTLVVAALVVIFTVCVNMFFYLIDPAKNRVRRVAV